ncbi:MAG: type II toxin-antitoxin system VapC family toxin [Verrucomicrobia bacterium]|nr:type II toxin-antitoxin system VapC family toxin [Verrucomicrobiota bacterium]
MLHRKLREGALDAAGYQAVWQQFEHDVQHNVWMWLPITPVLLAQTRAAFRVLLSTVYLRANDALHLVCARENGFKEIYSNDRHLLAAAPYFGLKAINVIPL